ncbi:MAG: 4Fe-4S binding protein [Nitrospirota bacterium]|nr:4Fe-4S binding protein [Nitrospirota bacterium]
MTDSDTIYRILQQHLDDQAVGFPSIKTGADIRLLKRLFTPDEAKLALHLTYQPAHRDLIIDRAAAGFSAAQTDSLLESMFQRGALGWKERAGASYWYLLPLLIGMYEAQDGNPSLEFLYDADAYMKTLSFGKSFLSVKPSQMRTIPINKSISVEHHVATYDSIRALVKESSGPYAVLPCICRKSSAMRNRPCAKTSRDETCLAFGDMAAMVLRRGHGRELDREVVMAILEKNEEDGLVLQPANAQQPEFVCSCCGCCCGMLAYQKFLRRPVDFWASTYSAEVTAATCVHCGTCAERCQVGAISLSGPGGEAMVNRSRCIGCGLCVPTCPSQSIKLLQNPSATVPPRNEEALCDEIKANRPGAAEQWKILVKTALKLKQ